jgi:hypothetical protein
MCVETHTSIPVKNLLLLTTTRTKMGEHISAKPFNIKLLVKKHADR